MTSKETNLWGTSLRPRQCHRLRQHPQLVLVKALKGWELSQCHGSWCCLPCLPPCHQPPVAPSPTWLPPGFPLADAMWALSSSAVGVALVNRFGISPSGSCEGSADPYTAVRERSGAQTNAGCRSCSCRQNSVRGMNEPANSNNIIRKQISYNPQSKNVANYILNRLHL